MSAKKFNIGDYVRTNDGYINKIKKVNQYNVLVDGRDLFGEELNIPNNEIVKSSPNIIDLIEVGDYVNGYQITYIDEPSRFNSNRMLYFEEPEDYVLKTFINEDIKSIVTKEQFESMEYKIGE